MSCCGANPGMVSWFVKQALLDVARDLGLEVAEPTTREEWGRLAQQARRQGHPYRRARHPARQGAEAAGVFVNTWSVEGFLSEGMQPAELGWGTHEKWMPANAGIAQNRLRRGDLSRPARRQHARALVDADRAGPIRLPGHPQRVDLDRRLFHLREGGKAVYRPTCHYAYHPCNDAVLSLHEMFGQAGKLQEEHHILDEDEIVDGIDELGVLLYGHGKNAYWYGSQLSIEETRKIAPYQNATGLQVTSAVLAGMVWALENPKAGIVEADEMDFRRCLEVQTPYLGPVIGEYTDWTPLDRPPRPVPRRHRHDAIPGSSERAGALRRCNVRYVCAPAG